MRRFQTRYAVSLLCVCSLVCPPVFGQTAVRVDTPKSALGWLTRPYRARIVPPVNMANTARLDSLVQAGNLYLSAQDVVDLVIENNIDLEIQRYAPLMTKEVLLRSQGGGLLRSVGISGVISGPTSVSLTGVNVNASGGATTGSGGAGVSASGGVITTLGPTIPSLDPQISLVGQWSTYDDSGKQYHRDRNDRLDSDVAILSGPICPDVGFRHDRADELCVRSTCISTAAISMWTLTHKAIWICS